MIAQLISLALSAGLLLMLVVILIELAKQRRLIERQAAAREAQSFPGSWALQSGLASVIKQAEAVLASEERRRRHSGRRVLPLAPLFERINALRKRDDNVSECARGEGHLVGDVLPLILELIEVLHTDIQDRVDLLERGLHQSSPVPSGPGGNDTGSARAMTVQETADTSAPGVGSEAGAGSPGAVPASPSST